MLRYKKNRGMVKYLVMTLLNMNIPSVGGWCTLWVNVIVGNGGRDTDTVVSKWSTLYGCNSCIVVGGGPGPDTGSDVLVLVPPELTSTLPDFLTVSTFARWSARIWDMLILSSLPYARRWLSARSSGLTSAPVLCARSWLSSARVFSYNSPAITHDSHKIQLSTTIGFQHLNTLPFILTKSYISVTYPVLHSF